jgi:hypothetical protein
VGKNDKNLHEFLSGKNDKNLHEFLSPALLLLFPELLSPPVLLLEGHSHPPGRLSQVDWAVQAAVRAGRLQRVEVAAAGRLDRRRQLNLKKLFFIAVQLIVSPEFFLEILV